MQRAGSAHSPHYGWPLGSSETPLDVPSDVSALGNAIDQTVYQIAQGGGGGYVLPEATDETLGGVRWASDEDFEGYMGM